MTDVYVPYIALCDRAIQEADELRARAELAGSLPLARAAGSARRVIETQRKMAISKDVLGHDRVGFGPGRYASEIDWGPEGRNFVDAIYEMQRYWREHF